MNEIKQKMNETAKNKNLAVVVGEGI